MTLLSGRFLDLMPVAAELVVVEEKLVAGVLPSPAPIAFFSFFFSTARNSQLTSSSAFTLSLVPVRLANDEAACTHCALAETDLRGAKSEDAPGFAAGGGAVDVAAGTGDGCACRRDANSDDDVRGTAAAATAGAEDPLSGGGSGFASPPAVPPPDDGCAPRLAHMLVHLCLLKSQQLVIEKGAPTHLIGQKSTLFLVTKTRLTTNPKTSGFYYAGLNVLRYWLHFHSSQ